MVGRGRHSQAGREGLRLTEVGPVREDEPLLPVLQACGHSTWLATGHRVTSSQRRALPMVASLGGSPGPSPQGRPPTCPRRACLPVGSPSRHLLVPASQGQGPTRSLHACAEP